MRQRKEGASGSGKCHGEHKREGVRGGSGRFARRIVYFSNGSLDETSISRFPMGVAVGDWSYSPGRGWGVLWLLACCLDTCVHSVSSGIAGMPS